MSHAWWKPLSRFAVHTLIYVTLFALLVLGAACTSALTALAPRLIESKFVLHVLLFLEYAFVVTDAVCALMYLVKLILVDFRRFIR